MRLGKTTYYCDFHNECLFHIQVFFKCYLRLQKLYVEVYVKSSIFSQAVCFLNCGVLNILSESMSDGPLHPSCVFT